MKGISRAVLTEFERVGILRHFRSDVFDQECCSIMRLLKYSSCGHSKESKAHTDYEFLTLVCANAPGLEIQNASGNWQSAPCNEGKAVILPGDMMQVASAGWVQSGLHKVQFGADERLSVIFFQGLGLQQQICYFENGSQVTSTFGKHLCGMLVRGAPHLQNALPLWETKLGTLIPERNPFRHGKDSIA
jgi:isopenicillin N synthase-like dioxygenase